jgi:hypothetical protein
MSDLRTFTLWARQKLVEETEALLLQVYGVETDGTFLPKAKLPILARVPEAMATRKRLEKLFSDEQEAGITAADAHQKLVKEVAFTHLNRLVAFKLMEGRKLMRGAIDRYHDSNGFKIYLANHDADLKLFEKGSMPLDDFGEGPNDRAYRHFLLWQCGELAKEVRVLFDPGNLPSLLFPRPRVLREIVDALNAEDMKAAWAPGNEETIGWIYQFFIAEEKGAAFDRVFKEKKKFQKSDIPAATQVFTPRWIVRFLVQNSLGRLWLSMHPDSKLAEALESLVPLPANPSKPALKPVKEIRVLDPATGTMHFGLVAFDLFVRMYREELENAGKPGWPTHASVTKEEDIPAAILTNNLFGIDIDLRAVQLAALALYIRAKTTNKGAVLTDSNLACTDVAIFRGQHLASVAKEIGLPHGITRDLLQKFCESVTEASMMGSLVRLEEHFRNIEAERLRKAIDDYVSVKSKQGIDESYFGNETSKGLRLLDVLVRRFDVVFTNPPYMSNRNMNPEMSKFMKLNYKKSKGDLYSAFIERCAELLADGGRLAMITQQSFMFISSFEDLRLMLSNATAIETMVHTGPRAFPEVQGEKVNTTAFVLRRESFQSARQDSVGVYFRLVKEPDARAKSMGFEAALARMNRGEGDPRIYRYLQANFSAIPGNPFVYWITDGLRLKFQEFSRLGEFADTRRGLTTADNFRFMRYWWEVGYGRIGLHYPTGKDAAESGKQWFPCVKGGVFRKWYGNRQYIINYGTDGKELKAWADPLYDNSGWSRIIKSTDMYFLPGITFTAVSSGSLSFRIVPAGCLFDQGGNFIHVQDSEFLKALLGVLNSRIFAYFLRVLNPTINVCVTDISNVPIPPKLGTELAELVREAVTLSQADSLESDQTYEFSAPIDWPDGSIAVLDRRRALGQLEQRINEYVYSLYGISTTDRKCVEDDLSEPVETAESEDIESDADDGIEVEADEGPAMRTEEVAKEWVSYVVGVALGRFQPGIRDALGSGRFNATVGAQLRDMASADAIMVIEEGHPNDLALRVVEILRLIHGDTQAEQIIYKATDTQGAIRQLVEEYLLGSFFKEHVRRSRKRPVYWLLQSPDRKYSAYLFHEGATDQTLAILQSKRYLGGRIHILDNELQEAKRKEALASGREKAIWAKNARELAEELDDLKAFDHHISAANNVPIKDAHGKPATARWSPEFDDGVLLNAAPLHELAPSWKRVDAKLDLKKAWKDLERGEFNWAKTAMRYWPEQVLKACSKNKSYAIAHGLA